MGALRDIEAKLSRSLDAPKRDRKRRKKAKTKRAKPRRDTRLSVAAKKRMSDHAKPRRRVKRRARRDSETTIERTVSRTLPRKKRRPRRKTGRRRASRLSCPVPSRRDDSLTNRGNPDRLRINIKERWERAYWAKKLGVTQTRLIALVKRLGPVASRVRRAIAAGSRDVTRRVKRRGARRQARRATRRDTSHCACKPKRRKRASPNPAEKSVWYHLLAYSSYPEMRRHAKQVAKKTGRSVNYVLSEIDGAEAQSKIGRPESFPPGGFAPGGPSRDFSRAPSRKGKRRGGKRKAGSRRSRDAVRSRSYRDVMRSLGYRS